MYVVTKPEDIVFSQLFITATLKICSVRIRNGKHTRKMKTPIEYRKSMLMVCFLFRKVILYLNL